MNPGIQECWSPISSPMWAKRPDQHTSPRLGPAGKWANLGLRSWPFFEMNELIIIRTCSHRRQRTDQWFQRNSHSREHWAAPVDQTHVRPTIDRETWYELAITCASNWTSTSISSPDSAVHRLRLNPSIHLGSSRPKITQYNEAVPINETLNGLPHHHQLHHQLLLVILINMSPQTESLQTETTMHYAFDDQQK
jgi:hypothetical protein